ncbi:uncharacterized protein LOC121386073 [Gigantopelta aegis]|uniref:uncharacterized protein LOC121386073 n=1 Tax=Gigantopelta aegis TaxID=1735272 RepID=UPI001B88B7CE|nr:uncharacterized protein LOC121386073 [Gigantopelta aegis]
MCSSIYENLPRVTGLSDNVLVAGTSREEHLQTMRATFQRVREHEQRYNLYECCFDMTEVSYFGHVILADGVKPDPKKIVAVEKMASPVKKLELQTILGQASISIDCIKGGYSGQSTKLTCRITGTIVIGITWLRPNGGSPQEVVVCNTANTICEPSGGVTGYSAVIDSRTQVTLTIESFNMAVDAGEWICRDGPRGVPATCTKTTLSGPDSVTLNPSPPASVAEGFSLNVMCAATGCKPLCSYAWTLGNQQISSTSQLKLTNINRSQTGNVYTCTATNSLIPKSKTKQFTLIVYSDHVMVSSPIKTKDTVFTDST